MKPLRRYWDSNAFLGWLNREPESVDACDGIIDEAKAGRCEIVTSTFTFAEVFWVRGVPLKSDQIHAIDQLFRHKWIIPARLDRPTAELARELLQEFAQDDDLTPRDSVHLASAIRARKLGGVVCFDTWDKKLHGFTGKLQRVPSLNVKDSGSDLVIAIPTGQGRLFGATQTGVSTGLSLPTLRSPGVEQA